MNILDTITRRFVRQSQKILGGNLVGIYLHGSAVMGCEEKSDIDLIIVVNAAPPADTKRRYMDMIVDF